jgi:hypothetical protein
MIQKCRYNPLPVLSDPHPPCPHHQRLPHSPHPWCCPPHLLPSPFHPSPFHLSPSLPSPRLDNITYFLNSVPDPLVTYAFGFLGSGSESERSFH